MRKKGGSKKEKVSICPKTAPQKRPMGQKTQKKEPENCPNSVYVCIWHAFLVLINSLISFLLYNRGKDGERRGEN
ncbi:hypothetical protein CHR53_25820 [Neobacillus mesonae]|uniref:Uncharacterized protein n=1 Tax=Neobacillus mesonae TaxID=1193713 RepID=A0A3Q9QZP1_9BACI|nr:hypothetical protein CHR53_25820 [Neobacillus mesonae]